MAGALSERSIVALATHEASADLGNEVVILDVNKGMYYGLEQVGARIWGLLREPRSVQDIRDALIEEFDVEPERCQHDLLAFLAELVHKGLIDVLGERETLRAL